MFLQWPRMDKPNAGGPVGLLFSIMEVETKSVHLDF